MRDVREQIWSCKILASKSLKCDTCPVTPKRSEPTGRIGKSKSLSCKQRCGTRKTTNERFTIWQSRFLNCGPQFQREKRSGSGNRQLAALELRTALSERESNRERQQNLATQVSQLHSALLKQEIESNRLVLQLHRELSDQVQLHEQLKASINSIHSSRCWRLTWPVRWLHQQAIRFHNTVQMRFRSDGHVPVNRGPKRSRPADENDDQLSRSPGLKVESTARIQ